MEKIFTFFALIAMVTSSALAQDSTSAVAIARKKSVYRRGYDTIWVSNPNRNVKITVDKFDEPPAADIGNKDFAAKILGCCDVVLKALNVKGTPASLYIKYGEKYYSGTIAYREYLSPDDEVIDWRNNNSLPGPINPTRAITSESPSFEQQEVARRLELLSGDDTDRFKSLGALQNKVIFKVADIRDDENFAYYKMICDNSSKDNYKIEVVSFLYRNLKNKKDYHQAHPISDNGVKEIKANSKAIIIYALPKFALTSEWGLEIEMKESLGSRHFNIVVGYNDLKRTLKF